MCPKSVQFATHTIETGSYREAMDWSLVLASQGIECTIEATEDSAWILVVAGPDADRADASINAYEKENATVWRHEIKWTGLLFDWRSLFFGCSIH